MTERDIIDIAMQPGLSELKLHLRITSSDQDALLLSYLKAAALSAEHHIGRCLLQSRFTYTGSFEPSIVLDKINTRFFPLMGTPMVEVDGKKTTGFTVKGRTLTFSEGVTGDRVKIVYVGGGHKIEADIKTALTKLFLAMAGFAILESVVGYNKHRPGETLLKGLCYVGLMTVLALFFYFFSDVK